MLIRSQDRTTLVNMDSICVISVMKMTGDKESFDVVAFQYTSCDVCCDGTLLGQYATMDKAKNVLDMIEEPYKITTNGSLMQRMNDKMVFQMPQDEEDEE